MEVPNLISLCDYCAIIGLLSSGCEPLAWLQSYFLSIVEALDGGLRWKPVVYFKGPPGG